MRALVAPISKTLGREHRTAPGGAWSARSTVTVKIACERDESRFMSVSPTTRFRLPTCRARSDFTAQHMHPIPVACLELMHLISAAPSFFTS